MSADSPAGSTGQRDQFIFERDAGGNSIFTRLEAEVAFNKDRPAHEMATDTSLFHQDLRLILNAFRRQADYTDAAQQQPPATTEALCVICGKTEELHGPSYQCLIDEQFAPLFTAATARDSDLDANLIQRLNDGRPNPQQALGKAMAEVLERQVRIEHLVDTVKKVMRDRFDSLEADIEAAGEVAGSAYIANAVQRIEATLERIAPPKPTLKLAEDSLNKKEQKCAVSLREALGPLEFQSDKPPIEDDEIVRYSKRDLDKAVEEALKQAAQVCYMNKHEHNSLGMYCHNADGNAISDLLAQSASGEGE